MPTHKSHDHEYIQPPRHDELPAGEITPDEAALSGLVKRADGRFKAGEERTKRAASRGGKGNLGKLALVHDLDVSVVLPEYADRAASLLVALTQEIALTIGGGYCGAVTSLLIRFAVQKTVAAEDAFQLGDFDAHRKQSESARMDLLYAREHASKEAAAMKQTRGFVNPLDTDEND